jgi:hypothetical protein
MFLHILNDAQQTALLALARQFIGADAVLADEEHNQLELMMAEAGWDFDQEVPDGPMADLAAAFDTRPAKMAALLEIIGVGHADETFSPEEDAFVQALTEKLGLTAEDVSRAETWVLRQLALAREARDLLGM